MGKANNNIKYTCLVDTNYTLSLYLLYMPLEAIGQTVFFIGNTIPQAYSKYLPNVIRLNDVRTPFQRLYLRILAKLKWRFRYKTVFFAQDHISFSSQIIDTCNYTLLEDAPLIFTNYKEITFMRPFQPQSWKGKLHFFLTLGTIGRNVIGTNSQCVNRIYTEEKDSESELIKGRNAEKVDLGDLWSNSPDEKKAFIKKVFSISDVVLTCGKKYSTILFTQPLMIDCKLTEEEVVNVYKPYIDLYGKDGIVLKIHPRDTFDYLKFFTNAFIMDCKAPMQLLNAMGVVFETAITVSSTAVSAMPSATKIIWIGTHVNEKIGRVYGNVKCPVKNSNVFI